MKGTILLLLLYILLTAIPSHSASKSSNNEKAIYNELNKYSFYFDKSEKTTNSFGEEVVSSKPTKSAISFSNMFKTLDKYTIGKKITTELANNYGHINVFIYYTINSSKFNNATDISRVYDKLTIRENLNCNPSNMQCTFGESSLIMANANALEIQAIEKRGAEVVINKYLVNNIFKKGDIDKWIMRFSIEAYAESDNLQTDSIESFNKIRTAYKNTDFIFNIGIKEGSGSTYSRITKSYVVTSEQDIIDFTNKTKVDLINNSNN